MSLFGWLDDDPAERERIGLGMLLVDLDERLAALAPQRRTYPGAAETFDALLDRRHHAAERIRQIDVNREFERISDAAAPAAGPKKRRRW